MYDKFDDDIEKSGLRFDGNEPTFDRRKIKKIVRRVFWAVVIVVAAFLFYSRQNYNFNESDLTNLNSGGNVTLTRSFGTREINERTLVNSGRRAIISQIHYIDGGESGGQVRFHLLIPNPFFNGNMLDVQLEARHGSSRVGDVAIYETRFWGCQMLNVTISFTEETVLPVSGETVTVTMRGERIDSVLTFEIP